MGLVPGLVKGLGVTFGEIVKTVTKGAETVQYHCRACDRRRRTGPRAAS